MRLFAAMAIAVILTTMSAHAFANALFTNNPSHHPVAGLVLVIDIIGLLLIEHIVMAPPCKK